MSDSKTFELYNKIGTQEKRAINRLLRALADGNVKQPELSSICRSIRRNTATHDDTKPKKKNGYILFYQEEYPQYKNAVRSSEKGFKLGDVAKIISGKWKDLGVKGQSDYNKRAKELSTVQPTRLP